MKIYKVIEELYKNPNKTFKPADKNKNYTVKASATSGIAIIRKRGKDVRSTTLDVTGEIMSIDWREIRAPVGFMEAVRHDNRIRPIDGNYDFLPAEEWLVLVADKTYRPLIFKLWEVE